MMFTIYSSNITSVQIVVKDCARLSRYFLQKSEQKGLRLSFFLFFCGGKRGLKSGSCCLMESEAKHLGPLFVPFKIFLGDEEWPISSVGRE